MVKSSVVLKKTNRSFGLEIGLMLLLEQEKTDDGELNLSETVNKALHEWFKKNRKEKYNELYAK